MKKHIQINSTPSIIWSRCKNEFCTPKRRFKSETGEIVYLIFFNLNIDSRAVLLILSRLNSPWCKYKGRTIDINVSVFHRVTKGKLLKVAFEILLCVSTYSTTLFFYLYVVNFRTVLIKNFPRSKIV